MRVRTRMGWTRAKWEACDYEERHELLAYDYHLQGELLAMRQQFDTHDIQTPETLAAIRLAAME